jgi:hypothetical protein
MNPYTSQSCNATRNAQQNLQGRSYYVTQDTLRFHRSRVLSCSIEFGGYALSIIESYAMHDGERRYRGVVFDIIGNVVTRREMADGFKTARAAREDLHRELARIEPRIIEITAEAIDTQEDHYAREVDRLRAHLDTLRSAARACAESKRTQGLTH